MKEALEDRLNKLHDKLMQNITDYIEMELKVII